MAITDTTIKQLQTTIKVFTTLVQIITTNHYQAMEIMKIFNNLNLHLHLTIQQCLRTMMLLDPKSNC